MIEQAESEHPDWIGTFRKIYEQFQGQGGFQVLFPEYRPDMTKALAYELNLEFYDYRREKMLSQGWDAGKLSLDSLTQTMLEESANVGLVVHNIEALLATKLDSERQQWLNDFLSYPWPNPIILPLSIFQEDTNHQNPRVCNLELTEFPKESFLMRLAMN